MKIAIAGSTGLVGTSLCRYLREQGHEVYRIVRPQTPRVDEVPVIEWDIEAERIEADKLEGMDAVINLAGANIAARRWSLEYKKEILTSRVATTRLLSHTLARLNKKPEVFLNASATGYYGNHPIEEPIDENYDCGQGFLATVCRQWEEATKEAAVAGVRVVRMRFGMVLSTRGGALKKMLPVFRMGLGGPIGNGRQPVSWISLEEIPLIVEHLLNNTQVAGAVNVTAPQVLMQKDFARVLGKVLHRPAVVPMPALMVKFVFGEMGEELLLKGAACVPHRLNESGYGFLRPQLAEALTVLLKEKI